MRLYAAAATPRQTDAPRQPGPPQAKLSRRLHTGIPSPPTAGDRYAARACVSTPDIRNLRVPAGTPVRVLICSDGVWDVLSDEAAAAASVQFLRAAMMPGDAALDVVKR